MIVSSAAGALAQQDMDQSTLNDFMKKSFPHMGPVAFEGKAILSDGEAVVYSYVSQTVAIPDSLVFLYCVAPRGPDESARRSAGDIGIIGGSAPVKVNGNQYVQHALALREEDGRWSVNTHFDGKNVPAIEEKNIVVSSDSLLYVLQDFMPRPEQIPPVKKQSLKNKP